MTYTIVGEWLTHKYRSRAKQSNDYKGVATTLRKQGYPFEIALLILFGRD